jgi:hypothetical protein
MKLALKRRLSRLVRRHSLSIKPQSRIRPKPSTHREQIVVRPNPLRLEDLGVRRAGNGLVRGRSEPPGRTVIVETAVGAARGHVPQVLAGGVVSHEVDTEAGLVALEPAAEDGKGKGAAVDGGGGCREDGDAG